MRLQQARGNRPSPTERRLCPSGSSLAPSRSTPPAPNCSFLHKLCALPFSLPAPSTQPCPVVKFLPSQGEVAELRSSGKRTEWLQKKSPEGWMSSSLLGTAQISADPSPQGLPSPRPTVWRLHGGLAWPPPPSPAHLSSPSAPPISTLSYSPKTPASPISAPLLELFRYLEFFVLLSVG